MNLLNNKYNVKSYMKIKYISKFKIDYVCDNYIMNLLII